MPTNYPLARRGYLEWYSHLILPPDVNDVAGNEEHAVFLLLAQRIEGFNLASEELTQATRLFLAAPMAHQRAAALNSLLLQMEGDLEVVKMAWMVIESGEKSDDALTVMRSLKNNPLKDLFKVLSLEIVPDLTAEPTFLQPKANTPRHYEAAIENLQYEVQEIIDLVLNRVSNIGMRLVRDIARDEKAWAVVRQGLELLKGSDQLGHIGWGLEDHVEPNAQELAGALRGTLGNIMEKLLAILQHNDLVRYTIGDWLDDLHELDVNRQKSHFITLLDHLYQTDALRYDVNFWLHDSHDMDRLISASRQVGELSDRFEALVSLIRRVNQRLKDDDLFEDNAFLGSVYSALQVGLLGILVFAGYDYLDEGKRALNLTRGVREILIETLPVSQQTQEEAENRRRRSIRN